MYKHKLSLHLHVYLNVQVTAKKNNVTTRN